MSSQNERREEGEVEPVHELDRIVHNCWAAKKFVDTWKGCIDEKFLTVVHGICMSGLVFVEDEGRYRQSSVGILRSKFTPPPFERVEEAMELFILEWQRRLDQCRKEDPFNRTQSVMETTAWGHYIFRRIHPFTDGNKRVVRFANYLVSRKFGISPVLAPYDSQRYHEAIEAAFASGNLAHLVLYLALLQEERYLHLGVNNDTFLQIKETVSRAKIRISDQERAFSETQIWEVLGKPYFY